MKTHMLWHTDSKANISLISAQDFEIKHKGKKMQPVLKNKQTNQPKQNNNTTKQKKKTNKQKTPYICVQGSISKLLIQLCWLSWLDSLLIE